jgi:hypothetical protein
MARPPSPRVAEAGCTGCRRRGPDAGARTGVGPWAAPGAGRCRADRDVARGSCRVAAGSAPGGDVPPDDTADGRNQPWYDAFPGQNCLHSFPNSADLLQVPFSPASVMGARPGRCRFHLKRARNVIRAHASRNRHFHLLPTMLAEEPESHGQQRRPRPVGVCGMALLARAAGTGISLDHASDQPDCRRRLPAARRLLGRARERPWARRLLGALVVPDTARANSGGSGGSWFRACGPAAFAQRVDLRVLSLLAGSTPTG